MWSTEWTRFLYLIWISVCLNIIIFIFLVSYFSKSIKKQQPLQCGAIILALGEFSTIFFYKNRVHGKDRKKIHFHCHAKWFSLINAFVVKNLPPCDRKLRPTQSTINIRFKMSTNTVNKIIIFEDEMKSDAPRTTHFFPYISIYICHSAAILFENSQRIS